eukprot:TRINITY_DN30023_c0_g1_i1.p1 TRINITY_DN30023_c0_g1~~TRINITY_DN30023_c0_g1_i1.p1  ORF type:complete len:162 (-),score=18.06 TRINITY_DN30023_c0_g1_i1:89-574(-)
MKKKSKSSSGNGGGGVEKQKTSHQQRPASARTTRTIVVPKPEWKAVRTVDHSHTDWVDYYASGAAGGGMGDEVYDNAGYHHNHHHHRGSSSSSTRRRRRPLTANDQHRLPHYEDGSVVTRLHAAPRPPSAVSCGRPTSSSSVRAGQGRACLLYTSPSPRDS